MNEIAKTLWDKSLDWLQHAHDVGDVNTTIAYTGMAEIALQQAQFAMDHPELVLGLDALPKPTGNTPVPAGPMQGPRLWGAP
jgi:hypothetical protein